MAADGSRQAQAGSKKPTWASDPLVYRYQVFSEGYGAEDKPTPVDHLFVELPWHKEAIGAYQDALRVAKPQRYEHCIRIEGESRASKTSLHRALIRSNLPRREEDGLYVPYAYIKIGSAPSILTVGQSLLQSLGDPSWAIKRSPEDRLAKIADVGKQVGVQAVGVDDLHRIVDTRGQKIQHAAADFLIDVAERLQCPIVYSGLPRMAAIFEGNEQFRGRSGSRIEFPRLDWRKNGHNKIFNQLIDMMLDEIRKEIRIDSEVSTESVKFRLYCSTGGLSGYVVLILRSAVLICRKKKCSLSSAVLGGAVRQVIAKRKDWPNGLDPFHEKFVATQTDPNFALASWIGTGGGPGGAGRR